jgi:hypothetical protein
MVKDYTVVVARYKENIDWLSQLNKDKYDIIVYDKSDEEINYNYPYIRQRNIGGDAYAYITHIVNNYDKLTEFCIFIQGIPFDHLGKQDFEKGKKLFWAVIDGHIKEQILVPLTESICNESIDGWYEHLIERKHVDGPVYMLRDSARAILEDEVPKRVIFAAGQQFIVHRDIIRQRSKEFYQKMLDRFEFDFLWPWHIERLWFTIWKVQ